MVGTDSWEKGEQFDASGAGYFNDYTAQFTSTEGSGTVQGMWQSIYSSINTANTAIASITSSSLPDATKKIRLAENRFLRAMYYFDLVRTYGAAQLNLEPTQGVSIEAHRTPVDSIYSVAIIPDLQFAIANLPLKGGQTDYFRATKGAAETLLSEVYLTSAATGDFDKAVAAHDGRHRVRQVHAEPQFLVAVLPADHDERCVRLRRVAEDRSRTRVLRDVHG